METGLYILITATSALKQVVQLVDNHKHLGVTFAADGNWTVHIDNSYISIKTSKCSS
jgi:hypothetical protein